MNQATAILISGLFIALGIYYSSQRYEIIPVATSSNPAVWKLDRHTGDLMLCAVATGKDANGKDNESGCGSKFKQF